MRIVLQRVNFASVEVESEIVGKIETGYLILLGITHEDTKEQAAQMAKKIANLRIFSDENGKINRSILDVNGSLLVVSQFTLYANAKKGNRPSFVDAASPDFANELYEFFKDECKKYISNVQSGIFGAEMKVNLQNYGPFTLILD